MTDSVTWKIGGEAGFGIMSSGIMLSKIYSRMGYHVFALNEYPSLIRGGHNVITVRIAGKKFESLDRNVQILVALNKATVELHKDQLSGGAIVLFDPSDYDWKPQELPEGLHLIPVPFTEINRKSGGEPVMRNTVAIGASLALLGSEFGGLEKMLTDQFGRKGQEVVANNVALAKAGYDHVKNGFGQETTMHLTPVKPDGQKLIINGSEAVGVAAVRAGLKFAAIYPMTPINALISYLADHSKKYKIIYKQPEDEIAGINMAIGASLAGVRSMVATSGGGFALMVEGLSLAGMIEAPVVIDMGMRVGPATGMPTWTEQADLKFIINAGHGEFARIVLAPGDIDEVFDLTVAAFNLADKYQVPVFVLTDKYINESQWCVSKSVFAKAVTIDRGKVVSEAGLDAEKNFKRYSLETENGVSPRSYIGMKNGHYVANSYEHDETGLMTEDPLERKAMATKRLHKMKAMESDIIPPAVFGTDNAEITFVSWGTSKGPILEAMKLLSVSGVDSRLVHYPWIYPFPVKSTLELLTDAKRIIDVEGNATAQLAGIIREHTGIDITERILRYDGRPFFPEEIVENVSNQNHK